MNAPGAGDAVALLMRNDRRFGNSFKRRLRAPYREKADRSTWPRPYLALSDIRVAWRPTGPPQPSRK
jgi:hypothetical protein